MMTDFEKSLSNPQKVYRPIPFWSWNEKLDVKETRRQIQQMNKAGLGGFFMHARGGLQTEYLSDEWFNNISASIDEGDKTGMFAFGYDENGWPSGFGGGAVNSLGVEYQQKYLRCEEVSEPIQDGFTLSNVNSGGKIYHCYFEVNPFYVDTLNPSVTVEFLKSTHEKYRDKLKDDFGKMAGFFTDEPQASRNGVPWSFNLESEYERIYGEQIIEHLPKLFYRIEGFVEFRFRYYKLVRDLFSDSYMGVIADWCKENGCKLTGHMVLEEGYYEHIMASGCCMPSYEFMDIPGMDHIGLDMPSVQTEMQLTSAANQLGKKQIISETFAACGWNVSFEELRRLYEHQMVHGVNLLCQHLESYSLRGIRKRDYPASLFKHQPWFNDYKVFNDTVSRIGMLIAKGEVNFNILVLHTVESGWIVSDNREEADGYAAKMLEVMNALEEAQLQYHLGESRIVERYGKVKEGKFIVGKQSYSVVIVPPANCLDENTFSLLCDFKNQGGTVIFTGEIPEYINGVKTEKVISFSENCILTSALKLPESIPGSCRFFTLDTSDKSQRRFISSTVRHFPDIGMTMYYLLNSGDKKCGIEINVKGESAQVFDAVSGKTKPVSYKNNAGKLKIVSEIHSNSSLIFFVYEEQKSTGKMPQSKKTTDISGKLKGEWQVVSCDDNSLTLDFCDLSVNGEMLFENMPVSDVQEILCSYNKPVKAEIKFRFFVKELLFSFCNLIIETPEIFDILLNGNRLKKNVTGHSHDISFKKIDVYEYLKTGENELCLCCDFKQSETVYKILKDIKRFKPLRNCFTYDMEIEAVYLEGDFGVFTDEEFVFTDRNTVKTKGGFYIGKAPETVREGALQTQGYPFFAGSITLRKSVSLSNAQAQNTVIAFERLPGIVTDVSVNGSDAGKIMWQPYELDISALSKPGENDIIITVKNSLRNLLGPFHLKTGETSAVLPFYFFKKTDVWSWDDGVNRDWTDDYSFVQNGLFFI